MDFKNSRDYYEYLLEASIKYKGQAEPDEMVIAAARFLGTHLGTVPNIPSFLIFVTIEDAMKTTMEEIERQEKEDQHVH